MNYKIKIGSNLINVNDNIKLEECYWEYIGLIQYMQKYPATYGMEIRRSAIHTEILSYFSTSLHEKVTNVLHDLSSDMMFLDFITEIGQNPKTVLNSQLI